MQRSWASDGFFPRGATTDFSTSSQGVFQGGVKNGESSLEIKKTTFFAKT